jgi:hypothetical protein
VSKEIVHKKQKTKNKGARKELLPLIAKAIDCKSKGALSRLVSLLVLK